MIHQYERHPRRREAVCRICGQGSQAHLIVTVADIIDEQRASYIAGIRNPGKKAYAQAYAEWIRAGRAGDPPDDGQFGIGYMAGQAVRMSIDPMGGRQS